MRFHVHFTTDQRAELPPLACWKTVTAKTYADAALIAVVGRRYWEGSLYAHVHGDTDPKHPNGMPMVCHSVELKLGA